MKLSYKYRIYPTEEQKVSLQKNFNFLRFLYNSALQERNDFYRKYKNIEQDPELPKVKRHLSYYDQAKQLSEVKEYFEEQTESIYSQCFQAMLKRLDSAYTGFFRRVKQKSGKAGFPRFKSFDRMNSICFPQSNLESFGVKLTDNKLQVYGIETPIKVKLHRPFQGKCKHVTIKKQADRYYLIACCDDVPLQLLPKTGNTVGIDLGLTNFVTTDSGIVYNHPKPYSTAKEKLAYLQRRLELKRRGSNNRLKVKSNIAKIHQKVADIRLDFQHKLVNELVRNNDRIIIEDLNVKSMLTSKNFTVSKANIQDASWSQFGSIISYKAERAGKLFRRVDPRNTSKMCSGCGHLKIDLKLSDRIYHCEHCGLALNRDHNAAKNIKRLGISLAVK